MSVRSDLENLLATRWADDATLSVVLVKATERATGEVRQPFAVIKQKRIGRAAEVPLSHWAVDMLLTIVSPHSNPDSAADQLDELVTAAMSDLDALGIRYDPAELVAFDNRLAYDITFYVHTPKGDTPK